MWTTRSGENHDAYDHGEREGGVEPEDLLSRDTAAFYLTTPWIVGLLLAVNGLAFLVGVRFYLSSLAPIPTWLWPLYGDSPTALALATLVIAGTLPALGADTFRPNPSVLSRLRAAGASAPFRIVGTLAIVWLVETGLWTILALNVPLVRPDLPWDLYLGFGPSSVWAYWGIMLTHAAFLAEAAVLAHLIRASRRTLGLAAVLVVVNDLFDYGTLVGLPTANHPPLRYEPGIPLAACSLVTSLLAVVLVAWIVPRD